TRPRAPPFPYTTLFRSFLATAAWLRQREPDVQFVVPAATARLRAHLEQALAAFPGLDVTITDGQSREVMTAADCVLLASGTAARSEEHTSELQSRENLV